MHTNCITDPRSAGEKPNTSEHQPATIKAALTLTGQLLRQQRDPYAVSYLDSHDGRIPSELYDDGMNGRHRAGRALKVWGQLAHLEDRHHVLVMVTITGGSHDPAALYNGKGRRWAQRRVRALFGSAPHFARLEYGPDVGIHVHVVLPLTAYAQATAAGAVVQDARLVWNAWRLALYLSKPADSRAALSGHQRQVDPAALADAVTLYARESARHFRARHREARKKGQQPPTSTRLPSTRFTSPGLPAAGKDFADAQCAMLNHPYQWHLKHVQHSEDPTPEAGRSNGRWTAILTRRLQPVRRSWFPAATFSRALLRGPQTGSQQRRRTPEPLPLPRPTVHIEAGKLGSEDLKPAAPFHLSREGVPDEAAVPAAGMLVVECPRQRRGQQAHKGGAFGGMGLPDQREEVHHVLHSARPIFPGAARVR